MDIKASLFNKCEAFLGTRLLAIEKTIAEIQESLTTETKSTAGDKHETGRAMLQLEREKAGNQLAEVLKTKEILSKIDVVKRSEVISLGSVIYTSHLNYFVSISAGELKVGNDVFYAISASTPIGQLLLGKVTGDKISFRNQEFTIEEIF
ncbi:3-oxoacyl-ACP synthase [Seonamhaeicola sp. ML3]|uniref:3-oxoacyl-ACP synthase n=1 Tax=Seonamhaeicola sp. ML3 TaxID=2937786 RepID=UPI00200F015B|nr:3-oxoacyl-ACP synthase [Seonamhaeicola sp. ML3]